MEKLILSYEMLELFSSYYSILFTTGELVKILLFVDDNGRTSRLIMNLDLMYHGLNLVIIRKEDRLEYYEALK